MSNFSTLLQSLNLPANLCKPTPALPRCLSNKINPFLQLKEKLSWQNLTHRFHLCFLLVCSITHYGKCPCMGELSPVTLKLNLVVYHNCQFKYLPMWVHLYSNPVPRKPVLFPLRFLAPHWESMHVMCIYMQQTFYSQTYIHTYTHTHTQSSLCMHVCPKCTLSCTLLFLFISYWLNSCELSLVLFVSPWESLSFTPCLPSLFLDLLLTLNHTKDVWNKMIKWH